MTIKDECSGTLPWAEQNRVPSLLLVCLLPVVSRWTVELERACHTSRELSIVLVLYGYRVIRRNALDMEGWVTFLSIHTHCEIYCGQSFRKVPQLKAVRHGEMVLSKRRGPCLVLKNHPVRNAKQTPPVPSASQARSGGGRLGSHGSVQRTSAGKSAAGGASPPKIQGSVVVVVDLFPSSQ